MAAVTKEEVLVQKLGLVNVEVWLDPATSGRGDRTGICVVGADASSRWPDRLSRAYVLEDATELLNVEGWGRKAAEIAQRWRTVRIGAELNRLNDAARVVIQAYMPNALFLDTTAKVSKGQRADPIKAVHSQGRVIFVGHHPLLENEMTTWIPADGDAPELTPEEVLSEDDDVFSGSPDALDAMIHGVRSVLNLDEFAGATLSVESLLNQASGGAMWFE